MSLHPYVYDTHVHDSEEGVGCVSLCLLSLVLPKNIIDESENRLKSQREGEMPSSSGSSHPRRGYTKGLHKPRYGPLLYASGKDRKE